MRITKLRVRVSLEEGEGGLGWMDVLDGIDVRCIWRVAPHRRGWAVCEEIDVIFRKISTRTISFIRYLCFSLQSA